MPHSQENQGLDRGFPHLELVMACSISRLHPTENIWNDIKRKMDGSELFVLHGKDLHLEVKKPIKITKDTDFFWTFVNAYILRFTDDRRKFFYNKYKGRVDFHEGNYSLLLKNVQPNDSGTYRAILSHEEDKTVAEYKVIIQDEVSSVNLTATTIYSSSSSCNLTVTCSTVDSNISITLHCDNQSCSLVKETSLAPTIPSSSLKFHLQQDYIICNHSNQVSWKHDNKELKSYCETESDQQIYPEQSCEKIFCHLATRPMIRIIASSSVFLALMALTVIFFITWKRNSNINTVNVISEEIELDQNVYENFAGDA
ncbi:SLAM family member 9-like [Melanotaenia boesemani]|uniref:SLAM family member 9-like n=1 Tax=Melanotaenia boesemani TaxID=1250792 RepID=UPI001C047D44|nr:SLAM family member 9-like [Melanotaenia boesemani]